MNRIGIDLGGTKIEGIVLDAKGNELFRKRIATRQEGGYESIVARIQGLYEELHKHAGKRNTFGIGTPGAVSLQTGLLKNSNTACLNGRPLRQDLEQKLGRRVAIQNDANCFAMAEAILGAGQGKEMVFGVIMGTGCGGGIVVHGQVWTGPQAIAGEWGHMSIDPHGPACYCGNKGCVETFVSGGGLECMWREQHGEARTLPEIVRAFRKGDRRAGAFMRTFFVNFGRAMANLIAVLDPDVVVLGGGVSNIDELYTLGKSQVAHFVFNESLETPIVKHAIGDSAGVIGAALTGV